MTNKTRLSDELHALSDAVEQEVHPALDASQVRREAVRRTRRNVAGVSVAAAVLTIGAGSVMGQHIFDSTPPQPGGQSTPPVSQLTTNGQDTTDSTGPTEPTVQQGTWTTTIPADFDIMHSLGTAGGDFDQVGPKAGIVTNLRACNQRIWPAEGGIDDVGAELNGPEYFQTRQVMLFSNAAAAHDAMGDLMRVGSGCQSEPAGGGYSWAWSFGDGDLGDEEIVATAGQMFEGAPAIGVEQFRWVRVGNAIGYAFEYGEAMLGQDGIEAHLNNKTEILAADLCTFAADPCK